MGMWGVLGGCLGTFGDMGGFGGHGKRLGLGTTCGDREMLRARLSCGAEGGGGGIGDLWGHVG